MDQRQLTIMANKFQSVFDPSTLLDSGVFCFSYVG